MQKNFITHGLQSNKSGCGRILNPCKFPIIWANIFSIWAHYTATFTFKWGSVYFAVNGKTSVENILALFFASDGKIDTAFKWTGIIW